MRLAGHHVVVTGAGSGIGEGFAAAIAREGAAVSCVDMNGDAAERVAAAIRDAGGAATSVICDITSLAQVEGSLEASVAAHGPVSALVSNAGGSGGNRTPFLDMTPETWSAVMDRNVTGAFNCGLVYGRHLAGRGGGSIVFTTSLSAETAMAELVHYTTAKGAVRQLMRGMALELAPLGVRVNAVAPGVTLTPGTAHAFDNPVTRGKMEEAIPLGRLAQPADLAGAVIYLIGDEARYTTGITILVDGGLSLEPRGLWR